MRGPEKGLFLCRASAHTARMLLDIKLRCHGIQSAHPTTALRRSDLALKHTVVPVVLRRFPTRNFAAQ